MAIAKYVKDPDAILDYTIDWSNWLPDGDTIVDAAGTSDSEDLVVESTSYTNTTTTVWLSGGQVGAKHTVTVHIETAEGREDDRSIQIEVKEL